MSTTHIHKTALMPYSAELVYALVERIEDYPQFLPWCGASQVNRPPAGEEGDITATVSIDYMGLRQAFSTRNRHIPHERIDMTLLDGPFSELDGHWIFHSLSEQACKVEFSLNYKMRSGLLGRALSPVFGKIAATLVDAFVREADRRYG